jgi:uncharacterized protein (TIGR02145 family)
MRIHTFIASVALCTAFTSVSDLSSSPIPSKRMADKEWLTQNLDIKTEPSFCYDNSEVNCNKYGRLYTWESAQLACQSLNDGWRLPTDDEWRDLAKLYGGVSMDSEDKGKNAYKALLTGGSSGFNATACAAMSALRRQERRLWGRIHRSHIAHCPNGA